MGRPGSFALLTALLPVCVWAAAPLRPGLYSAGELGVLEISTAANRTVGKFKGGGACDFRLDEEVLSGTFEDDVFVGTVFVCQKGDACELDRKMYPILAVSVGNALTGTVRLAVGCESHALVEGARFSLQPATDAEVKAAQIRTQSAAETAGKSLSQQEKAEQALEFLAQGLKQYEQERYRLACDYFEKSMSLNREHWAPMVMRGNCLVKLNENAEARLLLEKGLKQGGGAVPPDLRSSATYSLGVISLRGGNKRDALRQFAAAARLTPTANFLQVLKTDRDLKSFRGDAEFKKLVDDVERQVARAPRTPRGG